MFAHLILNDFKVSFVFSILKQFIKKDQKKITTCKYFFDLKAHNTFDEGKKQVGEHVEKSPEPRK